MNQATPQALGRYQLLRVLGRGAMGVVYEALDARLSRTVAIKTVLRAHLDDAVTASDFTARFEREAQAAARLSHPHIVAVYDFGEHEDLSYIVMEFVRGRELAELFQSGWRFTLGQALQIMTELLDALAYAHEHGIVHRDVKPANVLIDSAGHVKLADFGVARLASSNLDRTQPGTLVGTPQYMSPEQILGLAVGSRADVFAAGVVLYQFLTGRQPFAGGGLFVVQRRILQDEPEPPSRLVSGLPAALDAVVARALAKQPGDRYESAGAFAQDLRRVAELEPQVLGLALGAVAPIQPDISPAEPAPVAAPPVAPMPPAPPQPRAPATALTTPGPKWRTSATVAAAVLGLVTVLAAAWYALSQGPGPVTEQPQIQAPAQARTDAPPALPQAASLPVAAPVAKPAGKPAADMTAETPTQPSTKPTAAAETPAPQTNMPAAAATPAVAPKPAAPTRAEPSPRPAPPPGTAAAPSTAPPARQRCAELLERMQLGEALSPEQSNFFQARCTR